MTLSRILLVATLMLFASHPGCVARYGNRPTEPARHAATSPEPGDALRSLISLAEDHQARGDFDAARPLLERAREIAERLGDPVSIATVESATGNLLLAIATPDEAIQQLERAHSRIERLFVSSDEQQRQSRSLYRLRAAISMNLANALVDSAAVHGDEEDPRARALVLHDAAARDAAAAHATRIRAQALANGARLAVELSRAEAADRLVAAKAAIAAVSNAHVRAKLLLHVAHSEDALSAGESTDATVRRAARNRIAATVAEAIEQAPQNDRLRAYGLVHLAALYQESKRLDEAAALAERAVGNARRVDDALLRWRSWLRLARIQAARQRRDEAIAAYAEALEADDSIRYRRSIIYDRSASVTPEAARKIQLEFVDLLLRRAAEHDRTQVEAIQADLERAQHAMERLKAAELRDYFDDECVDAALRRGVDVARVEEGAALIYPIALEDRLELLVSGAEGMRRRSVPVPRAEVERVAREFRVALEDQLTRRYLKPARTLYDWLIAPLRPELAVRGVETLVFVPGGWLRAIPMAALHDGDHFLIEDFEVAMTPGLELTDPRALNRADTLAFLGGLSRSVEGFDALPHVESELAAIAELFPSKTLLNESFVPTGIHEELSRKPYTLVHIASHAEFPSREAAFMLTNEGRLSVAALTDYVSLFADRSQPLELLMLSACETARGDERAALGLSGIAVKAGARSAIGSLWRVNDEAARRLATSFYQALREPGTSRAAAIRRAQRQLLADDALRHPVHWAAFILIGTWL